MGWQTILSSTDRGSIEFIRRSGMRFTEEQDDLIIRFIFEPGQECFKSQAGTHRVALERDPIYRRGRQVMEPLEWMDRMNDDLYHMRED